MRLIGVVGWKNTGKTGLVERLVAHFVGRGLRVSTLKRTKPHMALDQPGSDTARHRAAGASQVILCAGSSIRVIGTAHGNGSVETLAACLDPVDLIIAEGWKRGSHPKIETHRAAAGQTLLAHTDTSVRAVASDTALAIKQPVFDLDDTVAIARFIARELKLGH